MKIQQAALELLHADRWIDIILLLNTFLQFFISSCNSVFGVHDNVILKFLNLNRRVLFF